MAFAHRHRGHLPPAFHALRRPPLPRRLDDALGRGGFGTSWGVRPQIFSLTAGEHLSWCCSKPPRTPEPAVVDAALDAVMGQSSRRISDRTGLPRNIPSRRSPGGGRPSEELWLQSAPRLKRLATGLRGLPGAGTAESRMASESTAIRLKLCVPQPCTSFIQEWFSPNFHDPMYMPLAAHAAGAFGRHWPSLPRRPRLRNCALLLVTIPAALRSIRHIPILVLVLVPGACHGCPKPGCRTAGARRFLQGGAAKARPAESC